MKRYDPFESMDRTFEQMMRRAAFGGPAGFRPAAGEWETGDERAALEAGAGSELDAGRMAMGAGLRGAGAGVRVESTDDGFVAIADLPGFEKDEITLRLDDRRLSIEASHEERRDEETASWRGSRRVSETATIPGSAELLTDEVTASYHNGVLEVRIPTAEDEFDDERVIDIE